MVVLVDTDTISNAHRSVASEYSRTRIAFLFGLVPIRCIAVEFEVELSFLHFGFLQTKEVGVKLLEYVAESLTCASSQSVNIP